MLRRSYVARLLAFSCVLGLPVHAASFQAVESEPFKLAYVPADTVLMLAARPSEAIKYKGFKPMADELNGFLGAVGFEIEKLESWSMYVALLPEKRRELLVQILVATEPSEFEQVIETLVGRSHKERAYKGVKYRAGGRSCFFRVDARTIVIAEREDGIKAAIDAGPNGAVRKSWSEPWQKVNRSLAAAVIDLANFRRAVADNGPPPGILSDIEPLWKKGELTAMSLTAEKGIQFRGVVHAATEENAAAVKKALETGRAFVSEQLGTAIQQMESRVKQFETQGSMGSYASELKIIATMLPLLQKPIDTGTLEQRGNQVHATMSASTIALGRASGRLAPLWRHQWGHLITSRKTNSLRQVAIALHNYHDVHRKFPAAAQMGEKGDGEHPVSWRVLILPYIGEAAMYANYRFHEPWDSPHNAKVTAVVPDALRAVDSKSRTATSYFAIVGTDNAHTCFNAKRGVGFRGIMDGTSNALLIVESKSDVHWAKPQDIIYDPDKEVPSFGGFATGGFRFARADGSVGYISSEKASEFEDDLRSFIVIDDRKVPDSRLFGTEPPPEELLKRD